MFKVFKGKKGNSTEAGFITVIDLVKGAIIIFIIAAMVWGLFKIFVPKGTPDQGTQERFNVLVETIKSLEDGKSKELNLYVKEGLVLYGFNKDKKSINYDTGLVSPFGLGSVGEVKLPSARSEVCKDGCLCICDTDCENVKDCKNIEGINYFYAKTKYGDANRGIETGNNYYVAFFGESGKGYLRNVHWGIKYIKVERASNAIFFS